MIPFVTLTAVEHISSLADVAVLRLGYKKSREFARRISFFEGELLIGHPTFAEGSSAAYKETRPVDIAAPDIEYSAEDDRAIDDYNRKSGEDCCMMQTKDD